MDRIDSYGLVFFTESTSSRFDDACGNAKAGFMALLPPKSPPPTVPCKGVPTMLLRKNMNTPCQSAFGNIATLFELYL